MKTIGLIGGMSWESSAEYYRLINEGVRKRLGPLYSAKSIMLSVNFAEIEKLQRDGDWSEAEKILILAAQSLERAGADFIILCTNTMHKLFEAMQGAVRIPCLHIADATAVAIQKCGLKRVGLLGTRFTMEEDFYTGRLLRNFGIEVRVPPKPDRDAVHRIIYDELCAGIIGGDSRTKYKRIIEDLLQEGCQGIILGCTEIGLLIKPEDVRIPIFDTTQIHAEAAVECALRD